MSRPPCWPEPGFRAGSSRSPTAMSAVAVGQVEAGRRHRRRARLMKLDMAALRSLEREKDISFDAARRRDRDRAADRLPAHRRRAAARPGGDRPQRPVTWSVYARELDADGQLIRGVGRHPRRLRPGRRDDRAAGDPAAAARRRARGDLRRVRRPRGRHRRRRRAARRAARRRKSSSSTSGKVEAMLPPAEQVPGERYEHGDADPRATSSGARRSCAGRR